MLSSAFSWVAGAMAAIAVGVAIASGFYAAVSGSVWVARLTSQRWLGWPLGGVVFASLLVVEIGTFAVLKGPGCTNNMRACFAAKPNTGDDSPYAPDYP